MGWQWLGDGGDAGDGRRGVGGEGGLVWLIQRFPIAILRRWSACMCVLD